MKTLLSARKYSFKFYPSQILNLVYANDYKGLKDMKIVAKNLNWVDKHSKTDLDDKISPLAAASFLGRAKIAELLLQNPLIDINIVTEDHEYTPLCAACMAGNLELVKLLVENGADTNHQNSMGYTPLLYCFSRMTETTNIYENKNICLSIAEMLMEYGADVNYFHHGKTLLMSFCSMAMALDPV